MQCSLFQSLLSQAVESHADSVSLEVRTHGTACSHAACQQQWAEYSLLSNAIAQWRSGLPSVDLTGQVLAELLPAPAAPATSSLRPTSSAFKAYVEHSWQDFRSPQQRPWALALSVAAVMLLIGTWVVSVPHSQNAEVAVRPRNNPGLVSTSPASNVTIQSVEWAQKASSVMANAIVSIPERGAEWVPSDSWDVDWQHKLEPIRRDAHAAWDALLDELPMPEQPSS